MRCSGCRVPGAGVPGVGLRVLGAAGGVQFLAPGTWHFYTRVFIKLTISVLILMLRFLISIAFSVVI